LESAEHNWFGTFILFFQTIGLATQAAHRAVRGVLPLPLVATSGTGATTLGGATAGAAVLATGVVVPSEERLGNKAITQPLKNVLEENELGAEKSETRTPMKPIYFTIPMPHFRRCRAFSSERKTKRASGLSAKSVL